MKTLNIDTDIQTFYVPATSFPEGVKEAHETLHALIPFSTERKYFGISRGGRDGKIQYFAAATELIPDDLKKNDLPEFLIKKGRYSYIDIDDFMQKISLIGETFTELLKHPDLDPNGYCLEWYLSDKVCRCLVKLKD